MIGFADRSSLQQGGFYLSELVADYEVLALGLPSGG